MNLYNRRLYFPFRTITLDHQTNGGKDVFGMCQMYYLDLNIFHKWISLSIIFVNLKFLSFHLKCTNPCLVAKLFYNRNPHCSKIMISWVNGFDKGSLKFLRNICCRWTKEWLCFNWISLSQLLVNSIWWKKGNLFFIYYFLKIFTS